jgi:hypothetical protein
MSSSTPAAPSNLCALKASADFTASMAQLAFNNRLSLHRRLFLFKQCERHKGVRQPAAPNQRQSAGKLSVQADARVSACDGEDAAGHEDVRERDEGIGQEED